jgi:hypothetical protein
MSSEEHRFELPRNIERHLAALSKLYAREGQTQKQRILVNAHVRVHEEWSSDNWDGGTYGHALYLAVPEVLYLEVLRKKEALQEEIRTDLNKVHNVQHEFIQEVFLEMDVPADLDWRRESGVLDAGKRDVPSDTLKRIWGDSGFRVFLSHKAEVKSEASGLKERLHIYGVSAFVAHEDIYPTKEWQNEIESALSSMDAFVALMTDNFHDSLWTDQEVGYALGRGVPIIAVKLGRDPYGFIGRFQALSCTWSDAGEEIVKLLVKSSRMKDAYIVAVEECRSFDTGNSLAKVLGAIDALTDRQGDALVSAFNDNPQVNGSFGFSGAWPAKHGEGLIAHLLRITGRLYELSKTGKFQLRA